jgi:hypothetical protein
MSPTSKGPRGKRVSQPPPEGVGSIEEDVGVSATAAVTLESVALGPDAGTNMASQRQQLIGQGLVEEDAFGRARPTAAGYKALRGE